jgi:uncharacterized membrane protein YkgB
MVLEKVMIVPRRGIMTMTMMVFVNLLIVVTDLLMNCLPIRAEITVPNGTARHVVKDALIILSM